MEGATPDENGWPSSSQPAFNVGTDDVPAFPRYAYGVRSSNHIAKETEPLETYSVNDRGVVFKLGNCAAARECKPTMHATYGSEEGICGCAQTIITGCGYAQGYASGLTTGATACP